MFRLLIVEDEPATAAELAAGLTRAGYHTTLAHSGEDALVTVLAQPFDAVVLDVMLPGFSGFEVVRAMRERGCGVPVLFLSALGAVADRVRGLQEGGDDYLVKPFAQSELQARIAALLRRGHPNPATAAPTVVQVGDLTWDPQQQRVTRAGKRLDLTPNELTLLALLLEHRGQVVTRSQIARSVWQLEFEPPGNTIDVQVRRLRTKVDDPYEKKLIHTRRGFGYVLEDL